MNVTIDIALVLALLSIATTVAALILFFGKLKWTTDWLSGEICKHGRDIEGLGTRVATLKDEHNEELLQLMKRIESVDKAVTQLAEGLTYVKDTVREIKEQLKHD